MSENGTLDDRYLEWLYSQISSLRDRNPGRTHWKLAKQLYSKPFRWFVPNDDNRYEDGKYLRYEFLSDNGIEQVDSQWMSLDCSMLEMLIALCRRVAYQSYGGADDWFWKLMENLEIRIYTDTKYNPIVEEVVDEVLTRVIERKFDPDGVGGLFPLQASQRDQRNVEIWYQASAYLLESSFVDNGP